jgi:hypothetical protein
VTSSHASAPPRPLVHKSATYAGIVVTAVANEHGLEYRPTLVGFHGRTMGPTSAVRRLVDTMVVGETSRKWSLLGTPISMARHRADRRYLHIGSLPANAGRWCMPEEGTALERVCRCCRLVAIAAPSPVKIIRPRWEGFSPSTERQSRRDYQGWHSGTCRDIASRGLSPDAAAWGCGSCGMTSRSLIDCSRCGQGKDPRDGNAGPTRVLP